MYLLLGDRSRSVTRSTLITTTLLLSPFDHGHLDGRALINYTPGVRFTEISTARSVQCYTLAVQCHIRALQREYHNDNILSYAFLVCTHFQSINITGAPFRAHEEPLHHFWQQATTNQPTNFTKLVLSFSPAYSTAADSSPGNHARLRLQRKSLFISTDLPMAP